MNPIWATEKYNHLFFFFVSAGGTIIITSMNILYKQINNNEAPLCFQIVKTHDRYICLLEHVVLSVICL